MHEVLPLFLGVVAGGVLGLVTVRRRALVWLLVSAVIGGMSTFLTGEWKTSWAFVLLDIPLATAASAAGFLLARRRAAPRIRMQAGLDATG
jgi:hypothetical protein